MEKAWLLKTVSVVLIFSVFLYFLLKSVEKAGNPCRVANLVVGVAKLAFYRHSKEHDSGRLLEYALEDMIEQSRKHLMR